MEEARESLQKLQSEKAELVAAGDRNLELADGPYVCPGPISWKATGTDCHVEGWILYPPVTQWGKVHFAGDLKGLGFGAGTSPAGIAIMAVTRDDLLGDVTSEFNFGGLHGGFFNLNWSRGDRFFGTMNGAGAVEGAGVFYGTLKFERM